MFVYVFAGAMQQDQPQRDVSGGGEEEEYKSAKNHLNIIFSSYNL